MNSHDKGAPGLYNPIMWRRLLCLLASWLIALGFGSAVEAQPPTPSASSQTKETPFEPRPPVLEYALAFLATGLVLLIICMPSRKR
jgi:hypothetical protein